MWHWLAPVGWGKTNRQLKFWKRPRSKLVSVFCYLSPRLASIPVSNIFIPLEPSEQKSIKSQLAKGWLNPSVFSRAEKELKVRYMEGSRNKKSKTYPWREERASGYINAIRMDGCAFMENKEVPPITFNTDQYWKKKKLMLRKVELWHSSRPKMLRVLSSSQRLLLKIHNEYGRPSWQ